MTETDNRQATVQHWDSSRRRRGEACLSDLTLDALLAEELAEAPQAEARAHLGACLACAGALTSLTADRRAFLASANLGALAADALARASAAVSPAMRPWWRRLTPLLGVGAAAAAALLLVPQLRNMQRPVEDPSGGDLRAKGSLSMNLYVKHGEGAGQGADSVGSLHGGEALHPGDRVRLTVGSDRPGQLAVLAVDTTGKISIYQPMTPLAATPDQALAGAIELDETLGKEVIVALRCPQDVSTQAAVDAAQRALDPASASRDPGAALGKLGLPCVETRYAIQKTAR